MTAVIPVNRIFRIILDFGRPIIYEFVLHSLFVILLKGNWTLFIPVQYRSIALLNIIVMFDSLWVFGGLLLIIALWG